ncbi:IS1 transposase (plasmid) [Cylindrospermum sp. NIES-4074]|nr:IS1 transposase [Cylindrospermum sp. NIES-4074]
MNCPSCDSSHNRKNGKKRGKQNYICVGCGRQFIDKYEPSRTYSNEIKEECLKMYLNGMGFRGIERVKGVHHTTIISWVKQLGKTMVDVPSKDVNQGELVGDRNIPSVGELDELETFVGSKKIKSGCGQQ